MKKLPRASELLWLMGIVFVALGVAICSKANLGVSMIAAPTFVVQEAVVSLWSGFSVGVVEYLVQGVVLVILCLCVRRFNWRYLLAFFVAVIYGSTMNFFLWILGGVTFDAAWLRWVMLLVGDVLVAFGVAEDQVTQVVALIMAGAGMVAYIIAEGLVDAKATNPVIVPAEDVEPTEGEN